LVVICTAGLLIIETGNKRPMSFYRENILGVGICAINMQQAVEQIKTWIAEKQSAYVCVTPAHAIMECVANPDIKLIYNQSNLTTPDGMAIVWLLKWAGHRHVSRVYGPDLLQILCSGNDINEIRHFFYGGEASVVEDLIVKLKEKNPKLQIAGKVSPPFRPLTPTEEDEINRLIQQSGANIVWVGLGSPRQEIWMASHAAEWNAVLIGVGAAFDFLSGHKAQAPRWIQRCGLEWLFRLWNEPARLWRRYIQYPRFVLLVLLQKLGLRSYSLD
jgi:N-acetylglucosaminyldiphosphoundecaprenol N-acetyl-beta-D-mannosaminyltransferase